MSLERIARDSARGARIFILYGVTGTQQTIRIFVADDALDLEDDLMLDGDRLLTQFKADRQAFEAIANERHVHGHGGERRRGDHSRRPCGIYRLTGPPALRRCTRRRDAARGSGVTLLVSPRRARRRNHASAVHERACDLRRHQRRAQSRKADDDGRAIGMRLTAMRRKPSPMRSGWIRGVEGRATSSLSWLKKKKQKKSSVSL